MNAEVRNYTDGSIEVVVRREADEETIAALRVALDGHREQDGAESYAVEHSVRVLDPVVTTFSVGKEHAWVPGVERGIDSRA